MKRWIYIGIIFISIFLQSCKELKNNVEMVLPSPDSKLHLYFNLNNGEPYYLVFYDNEIIIDWSLTGVILQNQVNLTESLAVCKTESGSKTSNNELMLKGGFELGEHYNGLKVCLEKSIPSREHFIIEFRAYNEGIAFRYLIPDDNAESAATILAEETQFDLYSKGKIWKLLSDTSSSFANHSVNDQQGESLNLPVSFSSIDGMMVTLTELNTTGIHETILVKRDSEGQFFSIKQAEQINTGSATGKNRSEIPWRVIIINKNNEKSSYRN